MHTGYHASKDSALTEIKAGHGSFGGVFTSDTLCFLTRQGYGDFFYRVTYQSICTRRMIVEFLESDAGREFLAANDRTADDIEMLADCDMPADDDQYFENQRLRALIAIACDCDAVEENDGWLVVRGKIELIGHKDSEAVELALDEE